MIIDNGDKKSKFDTNIQTLSPTYVININVAIENQALVN